MWEGWGGVVESVGGLGRSWRKCGRIGRSEGEKLGRS